MHGPETNAVWRKTSRSNESGDNCVELAGFLNVVSFRDSKDPDGPKMLVSRRDFRRFAEALKSM
ncbi:DUF397 domain-containing protein [Actinomadura rugatobispora]|uniref:DUF397 domain-containing protein n=1 Tax=Actinomadura rugatobispora TaxID=1994 RepID=A0ABW0ZYT5_9ACTN|nr:hypothetical protein GCM10010200_056570 [Actinomadura rugatobispora]